VFAFNGHCDECGFQPIVAFDGETDAAASAGDNRAA